MKRKESRLTFSHARTREGVGLDLRLRVPKETELGIWQSVAFSMQKQGRNMEFQFTNESRGHVWPPQALEP